MSTIFSKIIQGEIPSYKIAESETCFAFLDAFPIAEGHVLVVPKVEIDHFFDLDDPIYTDLLMFSKSIARAMKMVMPCERIGMAVIGLEVPHAHVHLVPIDKLEDISFSNPKLSFSESEFQAIAGKIREALEKV